MQTGYRCSRCGQYHDGPPFSYGVNAPELWFRIPETEREVGVRPYIELETTDHPLAVEQRDGITLACVQEIAELLLHGSTV